MKVMDTETSREKYMEFAGGMKTLVLSTTDENGRPFISYAPFVKMGGKFYIYISRIANHYRHLEERSAVDVMLIADEAESRFTGGGIKPGCAGFAAGTGDR